MNELEAILDGNESIPRMEDADRFGLLGKYRTPLSKLLTALARLAKALQRFLIAFMIDYPVWAMAPD
jgi:hypothetical protein